MRDKLQQKIEEREQALEQAKYGKDKIKFQIRMLEQAQEKGGKDGSAYMHEEVESIVAAANMVWYLTTSNPLPWEELERCEENMQIVAREHREMRKKEIGPYNRQ